MRKKQTASIVLALWLTIIAISMLFAERFDLLLFFILGFIGFLIIVEFMEPHYVKPGYVWYLWVLIAVGIVISGAIVVQKILDMLGLEIIIG